MTHSDQTWRHSLTILLLALVFVLVGGVSADSPPDETLLPNTLITDSYADIHAAIEQAEDWETIAELAQALPFSQQARLAESYLQTVNLSTPTQPTDEFDELERVAVNEAEEAHNAMRAEQVRDLQSDVLDVEQMETPAGDGSIGRSAAIRTVGDGCTYANVQVAVDASASGDTIRVQARTWTGSVATVNVSGKSLTFIGGYNSTCTSKTSNKTILDGTGSVDSVIEITGAASTISFEDFEIRGGSNDVDFGGGIEINDGHNVTLDEVFVVENSSTFGGGIHMGNSTLTLQDNSKVTNNSATDDGGGIFCTDGTINVNGGSYIGFFFIFVSEPNSADSDGNDDGNGGGIYSDGCTVNLGSSGAGRVINNNAHHGGGIYAINDSRINLHDEGGGSVSINRAANDGGGLYLASGSDLYVDDGFVSNNTAADAGGGLYLSGTGVIADFDSNATCGKNTCANASNNTATSGLGGLAYLSNGAHLDLKITYANGNSSGNLGNVVYATGDNVSVDFDSVMMSGGSTPNMVVRLFGGADATLHAVTIAGVAGMNSSDEVFGIEDDSRLEVWGSIIWDVGDATMLAGDGDVTIDCSITHVPFLGSSNEVADPLFLDPDDGNYHISRNSPAVDQCSSSYGRDVDYELRPNAILNVGSARYQLDDIARDQSRSVGETTAIVVYPDELDMPLADLIDSAVQVVDFGSYIWVELAENQARSLAFPHDVVENFGRIQFNNISFDPLKEGEPARGAPLTNSSGDALHFVQLSSPATEDDLDAFESSIKLIQYYPFNTYLVWGSADDLAKLHTRTDNIRWSGVFHRDYRLAYQLAEQLPQRGNDLINVDALLLDDGELAQVASTVEGLGGQLTNTMNRHMTNENMRATIWQITLPASQLNSLSTIPQLIHVNTTPVDQILDERSNQIIADNVPGVDPVTGYATWLSSTGYNGAGVTVAIVDSGVDWDHPDLNVVSGNEYGGYSEAGQPGSDGGPDSNGDSRGSGHGTHVAGTVAGDGGTGTSDGDGFIYGQGVAPGARLHAQDGIAEDGGTDRETRINDSATNADLSNNSWGADPGQGYNSGAADHDDWTLDAINNGTSPATAFLAVFAAGNQGNSGITDPGEAKNLLVVASSDSDRSNTSGGEAGNINNISGFSSRGLAADGRVKPDVAAPGRNIISTQNTNGTTVSCDGGVGNPPGTSTQHSFCTGTSMASPHVAGAAALFTEFWRVRDTTSANPHPSLVKAAIINTTDDMGGRPDGNEGWGRINIDRMLNPPVPIVYYQTPDLFQNNGESWQIEVRPADTNEPLRLTLYWDDAPGANNANPALVNDLYLRLQEEGGTYWRGNVFAADGWSTTGGSNDTLNNVENVWIENPSDIMYTVDVIAQSLNGDAQYYNGDTTDQNWSLVCYNCDVVIEGTHDAGADEVYAQVGLAGAVCGHATIVDAIAAAADGATIYIPAGDYNEVIGDVTKDITLVSSTSNCTAEQGFGQGAVEIDPNNAAGRTHGGIMRVMSRSTVTLRHVRLEDGTADYGGVAYVDGGSTLILDNASLARGTATLFGGGARVIGTLEMNNNSWIYSSVTTGTGVGGGVAISAGGTVTLNDGSDIGLTDFSNSSATSGGGAYINGGTLNVFDNSNIQYNSATTFGGGVAMDNGATLVMDNGDITNNTSTGSGGGIYLDTDDVAATITIQNGSTVSDNDATSAGGGLYVIDDNATVTINDSTFDGNTSGSWGGAIRLHGSSIINLTHSNITNNEANGGNGGGIAIASSGVFNATDLDMRFNSASANGGGIHNIDNGTVTLTATNETNLVAVNTAGNDGGGIYDSSGNTLRVEAIAGNQYNLNTNGAGNNGGAVHISNGTYFWPRGMIQIGSNAATQNGGGVYAADATAYIDDLGSDRPEMLGNTATNGNGGAGYALNSTQFDLNGVDVGSNNNAVDGGAIFLDNSTSKLTTTVVRGNQATDAGGGVMAINGSTLTIENSFTSATRSTVCNPTTLGANNYCSMIDGNTAGGNGGGIYMDDSTLNAAYVAIVNNMNGGWGSAMSLIGTSSGSLTSSLVANNATSSSNNTAVHVYIDASLDLTQNTIVDNDDFGVNYAAGGTGNVDGNIIWGNLARGSINDVSPTCNNTQNNEFSGGSGNISSNPQFETTARGDYRLNAASPSVDACNSGPVRGLDNFARPKDGDGSASASEYDMGAFEYDPDSVPTAVGLSRFGTGSMAILLQVAAVGMLLVVTGWVARKKSQQR